MSKKARDPRIDLSILANQQTNALSTWIASLLGMGGALTIDGIERLFYVSLEGVRTQKELNVVAMFLAVSNRRFDGVLSIADKAFIKLLQRDISSVMSSLEMCYDWEDLYGMVFGRVA
jgi:hypothetical protein